MSFEDSLRATELLMGFAFSLQSLEHLKSCRNVRYLFFPRLVLALLLLIGVHTPWVSVLLLVLSLLVLHRFQGPYNGGSDRMSLLLLSCLCAAYWAPGVYWQQLALAYLAVQLSLSYFVSGWVKVLNPDWRSGLALVDVFRFSTYPVSESLRDWSTQPRLLWGMSWCVMGFELLFPLALLFRPAMILALGIAAVFHFANACLFGLNRFFWIWISAYPSVLWFQSYLLSKY
ncbi:MAG: HTTM domain-containing protein [Gammaproteobacteria bacterium]|nr:HTTM domain-containing protein [Gammaproteobacteria bacterium]MDH5800669.1 HTTM domain-containing protein [Gammaproteobacteria bacterium]